MNVLTLLEALGTAVSLVGLGYGSGRWHERRHQLGQSLQISLNKAKQALAELDFEAFRVVPQRAELGTQLSLEYDITSHLSTAFQIWLGADIEYEQSTYFYETAQDIVVEVQPGRHTYTRYLRLGPPLPPGSWRVNGGIWFGRNSNPVDSIRLKVRSVDVSVS